jgi:hypothetical protein
MTYPILFIIIPITIRFSSILVKYLGTGQTLSGSLLLV